MNDWLVIPLAMSPFALLYILYNVLFWYANRRRK